MININGQVFSTSTAAISIENRGLHYGDALFESMRFIDDQIVFFEDHFQRLIHSMKILKMEIPTTFSKEFFLNEIRKTLSENDPKPKRIKFLVWRNWGGKYTPEDNSVGYAVFVENLASSKYEISNKQYSISVYHDQHINSGILSTLKTTNKLIHVLGSLYAQETKVNNCLFLNEKNNVVEALNGNLFAIYENTIKTPPLKDGCLNGVFRKQLLQYFSGNPDFMCDETSLTVEDLYQAEELWITNSISGIIPVTDFEEIKYGKKIAETVLESLIRL